MSQFPNFPGAHRSTPLEYETRADASVVAQFFNTVYAWMAAGLALTAVVAWWVSTQPQILTMLGGGTILVLFIIQIGLVMVISAATTRISATAATGLFLLYSAINGVLFSVLFLVYTHASIATTFGVTAGTFGATSIYGFVTKRDLTSMGSMLFMALIGLIIASLVNLFWRNEILYWVISYAGVLIFVGLTAYDTQKLKHIALQTAHSPAMAARFAVNGALTLYLDFINLFLFLLRILGSRRD